MGRTHVISCQRCGGLFLATEGNKSKTCPYCGLRVKIMESRRIATAEDAFTASEILRELKTKKRFKE